MSEKGITGELDGAFGAMIDESDAVVADVSDKLRLDSTPRLIRASPCRLSGDRAFILSN